MAEPENETGEAEQPGAFLISLGEAFCPDIDFLDPEMESQGVLMVQQTEDGGIFRLMGRGEGDDYVQVWEQVGSAPDKRPKLRSVPKP